MAIVPQPEKCGWCGERELVTTNPGSLHCLRCGKHSEFDGTPIEGNAHIRANYSKTLPDANAHGIAEFRKD